MTEEDLRLTEKYLGAYSDYCSDRECGIDCPVFAAHRKEPGVSCFVLYCRMRESGEIKK